MSLHDLPTDLIIAITQMLHKRDMLALIPTCAHIRTSINQKMSMNNIFEIANTLPNFHKIVNSPFWLNKSCEVNPTSELIAKHFDPFSARSCAVWFENQVKMIYTLLDTVYNQPLRAPQVLSMVFKYYKYHTITLTDLNYVFNCLPRDNFAHFANLHAQLGSYIRLGDIKLAPQNINRFKQVHNKPTGCKTRRPGDRNQIQERIDCMIYPEKYIQTPFILDDNTREKWIVINIVHLIPSISNQAHEKCFLCP